MTITTDQHRTTGPLQSPEDLMQALYDEAYGHAATARTLALATDTHSDVCAYAWALAEDAAQFRDRIADIATEVKNAPANDTQASVMTETARGYAKGAAHCAALLEHNAGSRLPSGPGTWRAADTAGAAA